MNNLRNRYIFIGIISSIGLISIESLIYLLLGFTIDHQNYDAIVTREFVNIALTILSLNWTVTLVLLTNQTLKTSHLQHFENEYFALLKRQWEIRDSLVFGSKVLCKSENTIIPDIVPWKKSEYFNGLDWFITYIEKSANEYIISNDEWEQVFSDYKARINFSEQYRHERPDECEVKEKEETESLCAIYAYQELVKTNRAKELYEERDLFRLVFEHFKHEHYLYFRHFRMVMIYLHDQLTQLSCVDKLNHYLQFIKGNVSNNELNILYHYIQHCPKLKNILKNSEFDKNIP